MADEDEVCIVEEMEFSEESDIKPKLSELRKYNSECVEFIDKIEGMDDILVQDMIERKELIVPVKPKFDLSKELFCKKERQVKSDHQIHSSLLKFVSPNYNLQHFVLPNNDNKDEIYQFLKTYTISLQTSEAYTFYLNCIFGYYLDIYFNNYKNKIPWKIHIKKSFNISDSHGRKLRSVGQLAFKYPKLKYLSISFKKFWNIHVAVKKMLNNEQYKSFWEKE